MAKTVPIQVSSTRRFCVSVQIILHISSSEKMESQSIVPNLTLTLPFPVPTLLKGHIPLLSNIPQHKYNLIILYQGNASQLNMCLKVDVIIHQSEQVDEDLSQTSSFALP